MCVNLYLDTEKGGVSKPTDFDATLNPACAPNIGDEGASNPFLRLTSRRSRVSLRAGCVRYDGNF